jgi:DNA polymerase-3 subunit alpha
LIRAGAFDRLTAHRAQLLKSVTRALEVAEQLSENIQQIGLFDDTGDKPDSAVWHLLDEPAWSMRRTLQEEKQALGFYLSGHLFDEYRQEVKQFSKQSLAQITEGRERVLVGVIVGLRAQMSQRGKMLIVLLDDSTTQLEVTIYNELYETQRHLFKEDELIVVKGQVRQDNFSGGLRVVAEQVMDLAAARAQFARGLKLSFVSGTSLAGLRQFMAHSGSHSEKTPLANIPIYAQVKVEDAICELASKKKCAAMLTDTALQSLRDAGYQVEILY